MKQKCKLCYNSLFKNLATGHSNFVLRHSYFCILSGHKYEKCDIKEFEKFLFFIRQISNDILNIDILK